MRRSSVIAVIVPIMLVSACSREAEQENAASQSTVTNAATAFPSGTPGTFISPGGNELGLVEASDGPDGVVLKIEAKGLQPGVHGLHVHTTGKCQGPTLESAGPHWNPDNKQHGSENPQGPHRGDLPNVTIASDGLLNQTVTLKGARLADLRDSDGSALLLHMAADDYRTDPSGNSGDRIGCAVI